MFQTIKELTEYKKVRRDKSRVTGKQTGPYIACVGDLTKEGLSPQIVETEETEETEESSETENLGLKIYVVVNEIDYRIKSNNVIEALEICYKIIVALNLQLPVECKHVWIFVATFFFKVSNDKFSIYKCVDNLRDFLNEKKKKNSLVTAPEDSEMDVTNNLENNFSLGVQSSNIDNTE